MRAHPEPTTHNPQPTTHNLPLHFGRYRDIAAVLAERLHSEQGQGTSIGTGVHLLVPSRSASVGVTRALLEYRPEGFAAIAFNTPELLARRILNLAGEYPALLEDSQRRILLRKAIEGADHPLLAAHGMEAMIGRSYRDLRDSGASLADLEKRTSSRTGGLNERHASFFAAGRLYEEYLRSLGIPQPADLLERAVRLIDEGLAIPSQIVFGFYDMTGLQEKLLFALRRRGLVDSIYLPVPLEKREVPPSYAYAAGFTARLRAGNVDVHAARTAGDSRVRQSTRSFSTPREEMREICRAVRQRLDGGAAIGETGIVSRSVEPSHTRLARQYADEFGFGIQIPRERPLRSHRIGRSILRLLTIGEARFPRSIVVELLRDGLSNETVFRPREIDRLDRLTRKYQIAGGNAAAIELAVRGVEQRERKTIPELAVYAAVVGGIERLTSGIPSTETGRAWAALLRELVSLFRAKTEEDLSAIDIIEGLAGELEALARARVTMSARDMISALEGLSLAELSPNVPSVWFGDVMTMRGRSFRHLFVFGMQEDRLPQRRVPDPLLTDRERVSAGLPVIGDGRAEEDLLFQLMLDSAEDEVVLSFARSDGLGKVLRPSPFLARVESEDDVDIRPYESVSSTLSERERAIALLTTSPAQFPASASLIRKLRLAGSIGSRSSYDGYIELDGSSAAEVRRRLELISPTWFEDFGECPQKFLFKRLLRADELEDPEHEHQINHRDKGGLDHRILERFYRQASDEQLFAVDSAASSALPAALQRELHRIVDEEFARFDEEFPPFNRRIRNLEREITRTNLERFILGDLEEMATSGFRPAYYEFSFGPNRHGPTDHAAPVRIDLESIGISFRGTIDRIDRKGDLYYRVVDYKSGMASGYTSLGKKIDAGHKLQLALYAIAAESVFEADPSRISGAIRPIGGDGRPKPGHTFELGEKRDLLIENLELFSNAILAGEFPALPDDEGACRYCTMKLSCRSRHDPEERRRMRRYENALELLRGSTDD